MSSWQLDEINKLIQFILNILFGISLFISIFFLMILVSVNINNPDENLGKCA